MFHGIWRQDTPWAGEVGPIVLVVHQGQVILQSLWHSQAEHLSQRLWERPLKCCDTLYSLHLSFYISIMSIIEVLVLDRLITSYCSKYIYS